AAAGRVGAVAARGADRAGLGDAHDAAAGELDDAAAAAAVTAGAAEQAAAAAAAAVTARAGRRIAAPRRHQRLVAGRRAAGVLRRVPCPLVARPGVAAAAAARADL